MRSLRAWPLRPSARAALAPAHRWTRALSFSTVSPAAAGVPVAARLDPRGGSRPAGSAPVVAPVEVPSHSTEEVKPAGTSRKEEDEKWMRIAMMAAKDVMLKRGELPITAILVAPTPHLEPTAGARVPRENPSSKRDTGRRFLTSFGTGPDSNPMVFTSHPPDATPEFRAALDAASKRVYYVGSKGPRSEDANPLGHAEMNVLNHSVEFFGKNWRHHMRAATLYVTLEPCVMCAGAARLGRVGRVVWATPNLQMGGGGSFRQILGTDVDSSESWLTKVENVGGVLGDEGLALLKQFFVEKRRLQRESKPKKSKGASR